MRSHSPTPSRHQQQQRKPHTWRCAGSEGVRVPAALIGSGSGAGSLGIAAGGRGEVGAGEVCREEQDRQQGRVEGGPEQEGEGEWFFPAAPAAAADSVPCVGGSSSGAAMVQAEEAVGICCYANDVPGFQGVLKQR